MEKIYDYDIDERNVKFEIVDEDVGILFGFLNEEYKRFLCEVEELQKNEDIDKDDIVDFIYNYLSPMLNVFNFILVLKNKDVMSNNSMLVKVKEELQNYVGLLNNKIDGLKSVDGSKIVSLKKIIDTKDEIFQCESNIEDIQNKSNFVDFLIGFNNEKILSKSS